MSTHVRLVGGPADGVELPEPTNPERMAGVPLDEDLNHIPQFTEDYYALAIYGPSEVADELCFLGAQRKNIHDTFEVEFIDGPLQGIHLLQKPPTIGDNRFRVPLDADLRPVLSGGAKVAAIAEYQRKRVDNAWRDGVPRPQTIPLDA